MISITRVENNRVTKFSPFKTLEECQSHALEYNGIVYEGDYRNDLWVDDGQVTIVPILESSEQTIARLESALDQHLDSVAKSYRYESIRTMVSYVGDPNPQFNAEGTGAFNWRSACYTLGIEIISEVMNGQREIPTEQELIDLMPPITDYIVYPV